MVAKSRRQVAKLALLALALLLLLLAATLLCVFLIPRHHRKPLPPGPPPGNASNPDDSIVAFDFSPYLIMYKSGRVHRLDGTARCAAGVDGDTGVASKDVVIDAGTGLAARMYLPPAPKGKKDLDRLPVLVFYHGGAFVIESAFTPLYHAYLNAVAAKARVVAVSVEYRLAPEHRLPAAYDDSWQALNWVARNAGSGGAEPWLRDRGNLSRLFVAGDSAGANIAHNMAMRAGTEEGGLDGGAAIAGLLLLDPYFWGKKPVAGETTDQATRRQYEATWSFICGGRYGIDDPLVNPLSAELRRLACSRVAVTSSGLDDFRPRGLAYAAALRDSGWGGEVEQYETPGERHVYFLDRPKDPNSVKELAFVTGFLSRE